MPIKKNKTLVKRIISLCFICLRKHDSSPTETYELEEKVIHEIVDSIQPT